MLWCSPTRIQRLSPPSGRRPSFRAIAESNPRLSEAQIAALAAIFDFEYMGAAEYEWEQVPHAVRTLADSLEECVLGRYREYGRKEIFYLVHRSCEQHLFQWIRNHLFHGDGTFSPKDPTLMDWATDNAHKDIRTSAWLALGPCPWLATINKEDITRFGEAVRTHFSPSLAQQT